MNSRSHFRFVPSLEALDERVNLSPVAATLVVEPDAVAGREVRSRTFALVDRTQAGGADSIWLDIAAPVAVALRGDMVLKGSTIKENSPVGANETITIGGGRTEADSFYGVGVYKSSDAGSTWARPTGNVFTVTFGGSL